VSSLDARFAILILCDCGARLRDAVPIVMLLAIDVAACAVEHIIEPMPLAARNAARCSCASFISPDCRLFGREPRRFAPRKLAAANSLTYALLLVALAPVYTRCVCHRDYAQAKYEDGNKQKADYSFHNFPLVIGPKKQPAVIIYDRIRRTKV
jgi:hypothetical protein